MVVREQTFRQWRITVEHYPGAQFKDDQWYAEVHSQGELVDAAYGEDPEMLLERVHQIVERDL